MEAVNRRYGFVLFKKPCTESPQNDKFEIRMQKSETVAINSRLPFFCILHSDF